MLVEYLTRGIFNTWNIGIWRSDLPIISSVVFINGRHTHTCKTQHAKNNKLSKSHWPSCDVVNTHTHTLSFYAQPLCFCTNFSLTKTSWTQSRPLSATNLRQKIQFRWLDLKVRLNKRVLVDTSVFSFSRLWLNDFCLDNCISVFDREVET